MPVFTFGEYKERIVASYEKRREEKLRYLEKRALPIPGVDNKMNMKASPLPTKKRLSS